MAGRAASNPIEIVLEGPPIPRNAGLEGLERYALDLRQHLGDIAGIVAERRDREAAVTAKDGGHAVQRRGRQVRVPEKLRVIVGVHVDESRGDDEPVGVDRALGIERLRAIRVDEDDAAVTDADVRPDRLCASPVDHRPTL